MMTSGEIRIASVAAGVAKVQKSMEAKLVLGFIGGAMISLGYLAYARIAAALAESQISAIGSFLGACVFPVGLIVILLAGGELVTGNMMTVSSALLDKKISFLDWAKNLLTITLANAVGALFVSYFFGHVVGLTTGALYAHEIEVLVQGKISATPIQCFLSGIGCNWFVGLALWLCYGAKEGIAKMLGIWFPVMVFVLIGFQHSVANIFLLTAAIFEDHATWGQFFQNFIPVYLGNLVGGMVFVALLYQIAYGGRNNH